MARGHHTSTGQSDNSAKLDLFKTNGQDLFLDFILDVK